MGAFQAAAAVVTPADAPGMIVWQASDGRARIEFTRAVLERVRFECSRAMNGLGSTGIGGVLLGSRAGNSFRVLDWKPIACDHSRGPAFLLSARDAAGLAAFLEGMEAHSGQAILGWFVSHTRQGLALTPEEEQLHSRYFPSGSFAIVVTPDRLGNMLCAVHLQGFAAPAFDVVPLPGKAREPGQRRARKSAPDRPAPAAAAPAAPTGPAPRRPARRWPLWVAASLAAVGLGVAAVVAYTRRAPEKTAAVQAVAPIQMLSLHAGPRDGRFVISWNGEADAILYASRVTVIIRDGDKTVRRNLSRRDARSGIQFYHPESGRIDVTLLLKAGNGQEFQESTRYSRPAGPAAELLRVTPDMLPPAGN
ncbi:MAG: hypothetical protein HY858_06055 [Candidatus Solibacter usitatus]|nr:hypothetical protein [Candidatus Solibacter usitatus]